MASEIIDIHGHLFPPTVVDHTPPGGLSPSLAAAWPLLRDADAQLEQAARAGTDVKVVNAPLSTVAGPTGAIAPDLAARLNDALAAEMARHDGRLVAFATVDAFAGDEGAEEARRAVDQLGFPGLLVDAARGDAVLSDPEARPTLAFAAQRGIPVFAHPVNPPRLDPRFARVPGGVLLARGTESALSTLALLASGTLTELGGLELLIAGIGAAALLLSAFLDGPDAPQPPPSAARTRLWIDTMGFDPQAIRYAVDTVGADRVVVGSDWPIMWRDASRERVEDALSAAGLDEADAAAVSGGNARRLLALPVLR
jgi:predicted TIM-barrel fold metal-dependent hydrolase